MNHAPDPLASRFERLLAAREHAPHAVLGLHRDDAHWTVTAFHPRASAMALQAAETVVALSAIGAPGVFQWRGANPPAHPYRLLITIDGERVARRDPYAFAVQPDHEALRAFNAGTLLHAHTLLGAHPIDRDGVAGVRFRVWAPNAERVSVVGEFNEWDGRVHPMSTLGASGVWELFVPGIVPGSSYKFELRHRDSGAVFLKSDPYARSSELRPATASVICERHAYRWHDQAWIKSRAARDWLHAPLSIYEVHAGSWMRHSDGRFYGWRELAAKLIPYVASLGFTHIELLPITEHPLDESWGYQATGYFAPSRRYGTPEELRGFIEACHEAGIGVILDWVPGHFPQDAWALARFDGSPLYEHADPRVGLHPDWGTHTFDFGRNEVRSFLLSSAHYWLDEFHFDGIRVDAVASMLYLDYSRKPGQWVPNRHGGRENLEAVEFLRAFNTMVHAQFPGVVTIAEESTSWPGVSRPVYLGGLGFSMKWNMGWMHDTLEYLAMDPVYRRFHHAKLTFGQLYAYSENFVLPLSHDEVVHGKRPLLTKMHGDSWQRFAQLRLLLSYQTTMPGKKLLFMGAEFGQSSEWSERRELDWWLLQYPEHAGLRHLVTDLNALYRNSAALHEQDFDARGFAWIDCHDADQSVISFVRRALDGSAIIVVLNFTPMPRSGYRIGAPQHGTYREMLNSDSSYYGGSNVGNLGTIPAQPVAWMGQPASMSITLPPLAAVILQRDADDT